MDNITSYENAFIETFEIEKSILPELKYNGIEEWDSAGHMTLIAALEEKFDITVDVDDIIDLSSFEKGKEILKKYDVTV